MPDALDKLRRLDNAASPGPLRVNGNTVLSQSGDHIIHAYGGQDDGEANAQLAALAHLLRPAFEALLGELPINGRGECAMCAAGSVPDDEGLHFDADNIWGGDRPCLQDDRYDAARAVLAQLEKALK